MTRIAYTPNRMSAGRLAVVEQANEIIASYQAQGFDLTLRQLYYQFVARDLIPNRQQEYNRLGDIIAEARLAGLVSWDAIVDRTRFLRSLATWEGPREILAAVAKQFRTDKWADQGWRVEVWIEKDALVGVIEPACTELEVPYFSCRGYTSLSEMWSAAQRLLAWVEAGQRPYIIHLGDHDPSGIDMTRDIRDRLETFFAGHGHSGEFDLERVALTMAQVEQYEPPPNPTKLTDSRAQGYLRQYGEESWELDALEPLVLADLIRQVVLRLRDDAAWRAAVGKQASRRRLLQAAHRRWSEVAALLKGHPR